MIAAKDAIRLARAMIGTPYSAVDCIGLIKWVIRQAPGGVPGYTTAGTNSLWKSYDMSAKYRDLTWRQEGISGARAGMLAFKRSGEDVHHVGLVTGEGTVVHSSSAKGQVVETALDSSWQLLAIHRYIESAGGAAEMEDNMDVLYQAVVNTQSGALNLRDAPDGSRIGSIPRGALVDVLCDSGEWWGVAYGGMTGYASGAYLARIGPEASAQAEIDEATTTLMREDGVCVMLLGRWRVAED